MDTQSYTQQAHDLSEAIDIAIEAVRKFPPAGLNEHQLNHFIQTYKEFQHDALNPEPQYRNLRNLSEVKEEALTYFQEGTGDAVNYFWTRVKDKKLDFKRRNKLAPILKRKKIKNQSEYDFIVDVLVPYQQEGLLHEDDVYLLNQLIAQYEASK